MSDKKIVTTDDGKKYEITGSGTLKEVKSNSGGIIGNLIDSAADAIGASIPRPSSTKK